MRELLAELQRLEDTLDRTPSMQDMTEYGEYSPSTYQSRFDSWNAAIKEAGLSPNSRDDPVYTDAELLTDLRELATELKRIPTKADMRDHGVHAPSTYGNRFGGWLKALSEAGLSPDQKGTKLAESELLDALTELADELGRPPTSTEMDADGKFSSATYFRRFESWDAALDAAGLSNTESHSTAKHSKQDLLDEIRRMADVLQRPPTTTEMDELGEYSISTYLRRFSSWEQALQEANVKPTEPRQRTPHQIGEQELLEQLRSLASDLGRPPTAKEMWKRGSHSPATYLDRYETWNAALEAAGLDPRRSRKAGISDRELIHALRKLAQRLGRCPQRQEMDESGPFSGMTYYNRFGSWEEALIAAGFQSRSEDEQTVVEGYCTVCCESVTEPVSGLDTDGRLYCSPPCEDIFSSGTVRLEDVATAKSDEQLLGRFAALLHNLERYVPDILFCLHKAIAVQNAGFKSATTDECQITYFDGAIEVVMRDDSFQFQAREDTLSRINERIVEVSGQTMPIDSIVSQAPTRESREQKPSMN